MMTIKRAGKMRNVMEPFAFPPAQRHFPRSASTGFHLCCSPQQIPFAENKIQIPAVHKKPARLAKDEHRIPLVDGIGEQHDATAEAAIPEGERNDAAALHLALEPLDDKAGGEQRLAREADRKPDPFRGNPSMHTG